MATIRHFKTYVAGTRHKNADGSSRNRFIAKLEPHDKLILNHEENNPHDPNAVRVLRQDGKQIGYLPRDVAAAVVQKAGCLMVMVAVLIVSALVLMSTSIVQHSG